MAKTYRWKGDKKTPHSVPYKQWSGAHPKIAAARAKKLDIAPATPAQHPGTQTERQRVVARAKRDPAFLQRALKSGHLRGMLPWSLLPSNYRQGRLRYKQSRQPIAEGSAITGRQLRTMATNAVSTQFAPEVADEQAQIRQRQQHLADLGPWYDQYIAQVRDFANQGQVAQGQAVAAQGQLGAGLAGVGQQTAGALGQAAGQAAAQAGGATPQGVPSDLAQTAGQAAVARGQLAGTFQGQQQANAAAQGAYTGTLANVVAPGQKVGALTAQQRRVEEARTALGKTQAQKPAQIAKYMADFTQQEAANAIARATLHLNAAKTAADIQNQRNQPTPQETANLGVDAANAKKVGVSLKRWQSMNPKQQRKLMAALKPKDASAMNKPITDTSSPFFGKTPAQVAKMPQSKRDVAIKHSYGLTHPTRPGKGTTDDGLTPAEKRQRAQNTQKVASQASLFKQRAIPMVGGKRPLNRHQAFAKITQETGNKLIDPALITAALDALYIRPRPYISRGTIAKLRAAKIDPHNVARALGVPLGPPHVGPVVARGPGRGRRPF